MIIKLNPYKKYKATIDSADFELVSKYNGWRFDKKTGYAYKSKYICTLPNGKEKYERIFMHRLIMNCPKRMVVDHINRDKLDNRKKNLRICTQSQNCFNGKLSRNNTSGYVGVSWLKCANKWSSTIMVKRKKIHLGVFEDKKKAIDARKKAEEMFFSGFNRTLNK